MTAPFTVSKYRKRLQDKYKRKSELLAKMRAAKARIRQERIDAGLLEVEPRLIRWHRFELGVRDKISGETHFVDLKSVRHASTALGLILKHCQT